MERDSRRDRGQWRGCYTFKDIVCEGDAGGIPKRTGGLKMGHTYYYYYELDAASEAHDPTQPSTNTCPYLPGQTVNTLWIPVEQSCRKRSASLTSLREEDFKTMDPASKFVTPKPASTPTPTETSRRLGTAPPRGQHQRRLSRSLSPGSWSFSPRKLFSRKSSLSSLKDADIPRAEDERSVRSDGSRSRDISPESLRRFLADDGPLEEEHEASNRPAIEIPEDITEENEDDDNFATSAVSETMQFTGLSPPPKRTTSPSPPATMASLGQVDLPIPVAPTRPPPKAPKLGAFRNSDQESRFSASIFSSQQVPGSPDSSSPPAFWHSEDEEEDEELPAVDTAADQATNPFTRNLNATLSTYSLPRTSGTAGKLSVMTSKSALEAEVVVGDGNASSLLSSPIPDSGLDDLVSELGWMAGMIRGKYAA
ncbi:hypothetical protein MMYC01_208743 [Madurella mycetomatis]|uniref:Uncharacterized protein n=1 Tax=Madurella mycetomatis TaxID=100816 RepID=A0A175VQB5_9PEZI|nr:hypothetical protein MMYC01_210082 [Madurella mycetomatis]KXX75168.1 hypothetical protein MMYC01_208743 [Madurella mycetomatis]